MFHETCFICYMKHIPCRMLSKFKILSWAYTLIANNNIRSVILEIKTTDVKSLKY